MDQTLTQAQLDAYLARIGVPRPEQADIAALKAIHRGHAFGFTWEAMDCFMGWPSSLASQAVFAKMVEGRRGGWCYEMNGLLGAALSACGFAVTRLCGGVRRADMGDPAIGNHLTLRIDLDEPWLAEAGLGDALVDPVPLVIGPIAQNGYGFAIEQADGNWLRFRNHAYGGAPTFDFRPDYADEAALAYSQRWLLEDDASPFRGALVVQRHFPDRIESLVNAIWRTISPLGIVERPVDSFSAFASLLGDVFQIDPPQLDAVWRRVSENSGA